MRIGIVGARLAGSHASMLLSQMGHEVILLDDTSDKEKPCGGGVTSKALLNMAWFCKNPLPHTAIHTLRMATMDGYWGDVVLKHPIYIFSRKTLDSSLRETACRAGSHFVPERALNIIPNNRGWVISTPNQALEVEFLVGADGANSAVRAAVVGKYRVSDLSLALGFYLPGHYHQDTVIAVFQENGFRGYLWSFPRVDHSSVGILHWLPHARAADMRRRVLEFISTRYRDAGSDMRFYAARIPCLSRKTLTQQQVCGANWALLGDAAGFVDAITAEGIYYALRSAELLADSIQRGNPLVYEESWRQDFGAELVRAAAWRDRFYAGRFLFETFTRRAIEITRCSRTVQELTDTLVCGSLGYDGLRRKLICKSPRILTEAVWKKLHKLRCPESQ